MALCKLHNFGIETNNGSEVLPERPLFPSHIAHLSHSLKIKGIFPNGKYNY